MEIYVWGEIPRIWNSHVVTEDKLDEEFSSACLLPEYTNCHVWWVEDLTERQLAILKYS
jgi:hypothetical protein